MTKKLKPLANIDLTSFADLDDGLSAPIAEARPKEDIQKAAHIANGGEASFPCPRCKGTGRWHGRTVSFNCFKCEGSGKVSKGVAAAAKGKVTAAQNKAQRLVEFARDHVEVMDFLVANQEWSDFYRSLHDQLMERGSLSDGQIAAVQRGMEKIAAKRAEKDVEREKKSGDIGVAAINKLFETAMEHGLKQPMFRTERLTIKLAKNRADTLYVTDRAVEDRERGGSGGAYVGKIVAGRFEARREAAPDTLKLLAKIAKNPLKAAVEYGRSTGKCCCCGRELTDPESVANGIGPVCQSKWGM
jgi:hypothetical protein